MSILGDDGKNSIIEALVELTGQIFKNYAEDASQLVDDACAYARHMVETGQWSQKKAQLRIKIATGSAAAYVSNKTSMQYNHVRSTIWTVLNIFRQAINGRVGFSLIPDFN